MLTGCNSTTNEKATTQKEIQVEKGTVIKEFGNEVLTEERVEILFG